MNFYGNLWPENRLGPFLRPFPEGSHFLLLFWNVDSVMVPASLQEFTEPEPDNINIFET